MNNREIINEAVLAYIKRLPCPKDLPLSIKLEIEYAEGREAHVIEIGGEAPRPSGVVPVVIPCDRCKNKDVYSFCSYPAPGACIGCACHECSVCAENVRADKLRLVEGALGEFPQPLREFISGISDKLPDSEAPSSERQSRPPCELTSDEVRASRQSECNTDSLPRRGEGINEDEETRRRVYFKIRIRYAWVARMLLSRGEEIDLDACSEKRLRELIGPCSCEEELRSVIASVREKLKGTGLELREIRL